MHVKHEKHQKAKQPVYRDGGNNIYYDTSHDIMTQNTQFNALKVL